MSHNPFRSLAAQYLHATLPEHRRRTTPVTTRVYKAHFKLSPSQTERVWVKLGQSVHGGNHYYRTTDTPPQILRFQPDIMPEHLLWTLHYMKHYATEEHTAVLFGTTTKTFRKYFWAVVHFLTILCDDLVSNTMIRCTTYFA